MLNWKVKGKPVGVMNEHTRVVMTDMMVTGDANLEVIFKGESSGNGMCRQEWRGRVRKGQM